jgi:hypothetical protein
MQSIVCTSSRSRLELERVSFFGVLDHNYKLSSREKERLMVIMMYHRAGMHSGNSIYLHSEPTWLEWVLRKEFFHECFGHSKIIPAETFE